MKTWQFISLCALILIVGSLATLKKTIIIQKQEWDLSDREHGICAPMYREGYNWRLGQIHVDIAAQEMSWRDEENATGKATSPLEKGLWFKNYMEDLQNLNEP